MSGSDARPPRNLKAVLEYDGTGYVGWERQKNGVGVQQVVEDAIERITQERTLVNGSGRTDAGVHAAGQVASFTLQHRMPREDLQRALNAVLPEDIAVLSLEEVSLFFHARFSATSKLYRYRVLPGHVPAPLARRTCHQVRTLLDVTAMREAARRLVGRHDFTAFCKEPETNASCVRTLQRLDVNEKGRFIDFELASDGFLYNMVRIIVGTLVYVGSGKLSPEDMDILLSGRERKMAGPTVPARGLMLVEVFYE